MDRDDILVRLRERILSFAASRYGRESAEDVAQEVMLVLHDRYRHVAALEELLPLALQIARFKLMALRRRSVRRGEHSQVPVEDVPLPDSGPDAEQLALHHERADRLSAALGKLGDRCREIFRLRLQGQGFAEIQRLLGAASINTVYTWEARCRKQLQELLGKEDRR